MSDQRLLYDKASAAQMLSVSPRTIDELRKASKLVGVFHKGRYVFPHSELERYVARVLAEAS